MTAERIAFLGRVDDPAFPPWIERRRLRLGLAGGIAAQAPGRIEVEVDGEPDMIDAFELACSLGPAEVWVEETHRGSEEAESRAADEVLGKPSPDRP